MSFRAILLEKDENQVFSAACTEVSKKTLLAQEGDTLIEVTYSTLNYKDALALTNSSPVVRKWPMIPGIDCAGKVVESSDPRYLAGQQVILNGFGVGETHWGCLAEYAYLKADWLIPLPDGITAWQSMAIGTAGYTAALCVLSLLQHGLTPDTGPVLVTGASGGVGSVAIHLLSQMGFSVTASTGKPEEDAYLKALGAKDIIDRNSLNQPGKPLQKEWWAGAIDTVGSYTLVNVCAQIQYGGIVAACGLAQGMDFPASVAPFILRGVTLCGIDSVMASYEKRVKAWQCLVEHMDIDILNTIAQTISLSQCVDAAKDIMAEKIKGRFVVDVHQ